MGTDQIIKECLVQSILVKKILLCQHPNTFETPLMAELEEEARSEVNKLSAGN